MSPRSPSSPDQKSQPPPTQSLTARPRSTFRSRSRSIGPALVALAIAILALALSISPVRRTAASLLKTPYKSAGGLSVFPATSFSATSPLALRSATTSTATATAAIAQGTSTGRGVHVHTMPSKEDREWNRLADHMDQFHNHFRYEFNRVYTLADGGFHKEGMTLPRFLREAQQLSHHLDMHHRIESYIFPVLAKRMPQFKAGARESGEHLKKHKQIHDGLDKYDAFLSSALSNPSSYNAEELRGVLDSFRTVLFSHLDEEVKDLGAESMKAAGWSLDEVRRIPM